MSKNPENEESQIFLGPMLKNQAEDAGPTPTSESPHPYEKGDEVPII